MNIKKIFLVFLILLLSLFLHLHNYTEYPQRGATADEYSYSFLGVSLLTKHVPISWSAVNGYKHINYLTIKKMSFPIVYPYFDHPPFNGLLVGMWALINGEKTFPEIQLSVIRLVPIALSIFTTLLVFLIAGRLTDFKTSVWAMLIYSTTTIFVINTRVVLAENLFTPLMLFGIYLFSLFEKNITVKKSILLGAIAGLSFLTKELGITAFFTYLYFFLKEKIKMKYVLILTFTFVIFFLSYLAYGKYYDWNVFLQIVYNQSNRPIGPEVIQMILFGPIIVNKPYFDGWYFLGFVVFFMSFLNVKKYELILLPSFIYFLLCVFSLNRTGEMGWYMIPFFPIFAILIADFLSESFEKNNWFIFVFLIFVGLYEVQYIYEKSFGLVPLQFRIILIVMFAPLLLLAVFKKDKWLTRLSKVWFYLLILGNIYLTYSYAHPA